MPPHLRLAVSGMHRIFGIGIQGVSNVYMVSGIPCIFGIGIQHTYGIGCHIFGIGYTVYLIQGGEEPLRCTSFFAKEPLITGPYMYTLMCGYPMYMWSRIYCVFDTGWRRIIKMHVIFRKRATNYMAFVRKMTYTFMCGYPMYIWYRIYCVY